MRGRQGLNITLNDPAFTLGVPFSISLAEEAGDIAGENELLFELR